MLWLVASVLHAASPRTDLNFATAAGDTQLKRRGIRLHSREKARPLGCILRPRTQCYSQLQLAQRRARADAGAARNRHAQLSKEYSLQSATHGSQRAPATN